MEHINHYMILISLDAKKYISICEHGTIHLTWGMTTFRFRLQDFAYLSRVLNEKKSCPDDAFCPEPISLSLNAEGGVTLRILQYGLFLSSEEFLKLVDMVKIAMQQLNTFPGELSQSSVPLVFPNHAERLVFFSPN